jgi:hypothetical protein
MPSTISAKSLILCNQFRYLASGSHVPNTITTEVCQLGMHIMYLVSCERIIACHTILRFVIEPYSQDLLPHKLTPPSISTTCIDILTLYHFLSYPQYWTKPSTSVRYKARRFCTRSYHLAFYRTTSTGQNQVLVYATKHEIFFSFFSGCLPPNDMAPTLLHCV